MSYKITVDHEKCVGCGACESTCDNFKVNDGKSSPIKSEVEEIGCNREAEDVCPVSAISVEKL